MNHVQQTPWPPAPSRGTTPLAIDMRHSRRVREAQDHGMWRPRAGIRHDDGPLCPIERQRAHRVSRAFCIAGTFLAVSLMLAHMAGVGL